MGARYDVFLSYNHADKPALEQLYGQLRAQGLEPWLDSSELPFGTPWPPEAEKALSEQSASCAVFIGPNGLGAWQEPEMRLAHERQIEARRNNGGFPVIPVLLPGGEVKTIPGFLKAHNRVAFPTLDDEDAFDDLVRAVRGLSRRIKPPPGSEGQCPYRGLEFFDVAHAPYFYGREKLVARLIEKLRSNIQTKGANRFLAIIGASGSGKSSLARAGLVARLQQGIIASSDEWRVVICRPGDDPCASVALELAKTGGLDLNGQAAFKDRLKDRMPNEPSALHESVRLVLQTDDPQKRLLLLVDQFEELFTICHDEKLRQAFVDNLVHAAQVMQGQTVVLLAMRADFYAKCAAHRELARALSECQELIGPMAADELREVIDEPAEKVGCELEPGLTDLLIKDVINDPGSLPFLQFALKELWNKRTGRKLTTEAYRAIGGVPGALQRKADEVYAGLNPAQQQICRRIFLRLTQPGEGTEDTKRRVPLSELKPQAGSQAEVEAVLLDLSEAGTRLVTGETEGGQEFFEVAHEALIRGWPELRKWIDSDRHALFTRTRLTEAAKEWSHQGRNAGYLYSGARLAAAKEWAAAHSDEINPLESEFVRVGRREAVKRRLILGTAFSTIVAASVVGLTILYLNADSERRAADQQRNVAEQRRIEAQTVTKFYEENVLAAARPKGYWGGAGKDVTLQGALDGAGPKIDKVFAGQPALEAGVRHTLGMTYFYLGKYDAANPHLERSYSLRLQTLGPESGDTLTSMLDLARERWKQSRYKEAIDLSRGALETRRRISGADSEETLWTQVNLGLFLSEDGQVDEAETVLRDAIERCKRDLGPDHHHTLYGQNDLALVLWSKGKRQESVALDRETLAGRRRSVGPDNPDTLRSMANLAGSLNAMGKVDEAESLMRESLAMKRKVLGPDHEETLWSERGLGNLLSEHGKFAEAETHLRTALETARRVYGPNHEETALAAAALGNCLKKQGKYAEAQTQLQYALDTQRRLFGGDHPTTIGALYSMGRVLEAQGKIVEAENLFRQRLNACRNRYGPDGDDTLWAQVNLASVLQSEHKLDDAESLARDAFDRRLKVTGPGQRDTVVTQEWLISVLWDNAKYQECIALQRQVVDSYRRAHNSTQVEILGSKSLLAQYLESAGKLAEAETLLTDILNGQRQLLHADHIKTLTTENELGCVLYQQGKFSEAEPHLQFALKTRATLLGAETPDTLGSLSSMAAFLQVQRRFNEAEKLVRQRLDASTRRFGSDHDYTLAAKSNLADLLLDEGKLTDAENLARTVLEVRRKNRGKDNLAAIAAEEAVACILQADGKVTLAETELRECLEAYRKSTGQPSFAFARTLYSLGDVLLDESRPQEAEPLLRNCLRFWEQLASDPAWLSGIWDGLNDCLAMQGKVSQIEPLIASAQKLLDSQQRVLGSDNLDVAGTLAILGSMLANANRPTEAQPLLTRCLSIREKRLASNDWKLARTRSMLGGTLTAQGKFAEAETLVVRGYQGLVGTKATPPRRISDALNLVIALYEKWGKPEQAKEWRRKRLAAVP